MLTACFTSSDKWQLGEEGEKDKFHKLAKPCDKPVTKTSFQNLWWFSINLGWQFREMALILPFLLWRYSLALLVNVSSSFLANKLCVGFPTREQLEPFTNEAVPYRQN